MKLHHSNSESSCKTGVISNDFDRLESLLSDQVEVLPSDVMDKQIIAAAHSEIQSPKKVTSYRTSWWRRLSLPLYVTAGFTLTVFAFKSLWLSPVYFVESSADQTTSVLFESGTTETQAETVNSSRIKRELPELIVAPDELARTKTDSIVADYKPNINDGFVQPNIKKQDVYTGSHFSRAAYPEKEAWARKIIDFMRDGNMDDARSELIRFKNVYPDYPIEEQIKVLVQ